MAYRDHNERVLSGLKYGDLIGMDTLAGMLTHLAVYIENGEMVQFCNHEATQTIIFNAISCSTSVGGFYEITPIDHDRKIYKCNHYDGSYPPLTEEEIRRNVQSKMGRRDDYNVCSYNCQHFANWCRYGKKLSQAADSVTTTALSAAASFIGAGAAGSGGDATTSARDVAIRGAITGVQMFSSRGNQS